jgi:hypothetical protein
MLGKAKMKVAKSATRKRTRTVLRGRWRERKKRQNNVT